MWRFISREHPKVTRLVVQKSQTKGSIFRSPLAPDLLDQSLFTEEIQIRTGQHCWEASDSMVPVLLLQMTLSILWEHHIQAHGIHSRKPSSRSIPVSNFRFSVIRLKSPTPTTRVGRWCTNHLCCRWTVKSSRVTQPHHNTAVVSSLVNQQVV